MRDNLVALVEQASNCDGNPAIVTAVVALLAHDAGPGGAPVPRRRLIELVDHVLLVLLTGVRVRE